MCCTAFFVFFRIGELLEITSSGQQGLSTNDIAVDSLSEPSAIQIHLRRSKTDQYGQGVAIYLGRTEGDICPVTALISYLGVRGSSGGPLFTYSDGKALTKQCLVANVREALEALGYDSKVYAGHSFRIGAATTAAERGIEDSVIKLLGRWESACSLSNLRAGFQGVSVGSIQTSCSKPKVN